MEATPKPKLILVVEDDFYIRDLYRVALEHSGFRVITTADGEQAMEVLATVRPDLVLLDLMLPRSSGFDVLHFIRAAEHLPEHLPVVIVTNLDTEEAMVQAEKLAVDRYLRKSSNRPDEVVSHVRAILAAG